MKNASKFPKNCKDVTCGECKKCYEEYVKLKMAGLLD